MGPEAKIEAYLLKRVKQIGGLCWKFVSPGNAGVPDRVVVYNSTVTFVELKSPGGRVSPLQWQMIQQLRNRGARVYILWSKQDVEEFIQELLCLCTTF